MALIQNAHIAYEDHSQRFCIFFDAYTSEGLSSLQIVNLPDLPDIPGLKWDVSQLNDRVCWVERDDKTNIIRFIDWWRK